MICIRDVAKITLLAGTLALAGCSSDSSTSTKVPTGPGTPPPPPPPTNCGTAGTIVICATGTPASLPADGTSTSTITATVTDNAVAVSGGTVGFSLNNPALGTLSAATATTAANGTATITFTAGTTAATATITATHLGASTVVSLTLGQTASAGGIQFVSANPGSVGLQGSGQPTTSTATFAVTDATGTPLPNASVAFTMVGPGGGAFIGPLDGTPNTDSGTTDGSGLVSVILNSGNVAGPVTITASVSVGGNTFSASSSVISIGGGVPSASHFDLAAARLNLPGLVKSGFTTTLTAFAADRFSNFNVLAGTQVSFFTEAGAVDTSGTLDADGITTVTFRTQLPHPVDTPPLLAPNLEDGWLNVIAVVRGEESFTDVNGNGVFDSGTDTFFDLSEPAIDANDNGLFDPATEFFVDTNANGQFDGPNGVWDGPNCSQAGCNSSPNIWRPIRMMFTGNLDILGVTTCAITPTAFAVADGGSQTFTLTVNDINGNIPVPGTTISASLSGAGQLVGQTSFSVADGVGGPFTGIVAVVDATAGDTDPPATSTLTLKVTTPAGEVVTCQDIFVTGTVD